MLAIRGYGVGMGKGETKPNESVVAPWPAPEMAVGPDTSVDNKDKISSNEIFWLNDVRQSISSASCA